MTSRRARAARATVLLATAGLLCTGCSLLSRPAGHTAPGRPPSSSPARPRAAALTPLAALLPFPPARLQAATALAARFTVTWDSWSWRRSPAAWLAPLKAMAASSLYPALAQAAGTPGVLAQRTATRQAATAAVTSALIRDLTPGSVTVTVTARQVITSASGTTQATAGFAVTLTPAGSGWAVWDIEPSNAGNS